MPTPGLGGGIPGYPAAAPDPLWKPPKKPMNVLLIPLIISVLLFVGALGFGIYAFSGMQDYKNNSDKKVEVAVEIAKQETSTSKDKEFVEKEKIPHRMYTSPDTLATVHFEYPKTWAAYMNEDTKTNRGTPLDGYVHPDFVPAADSGVDFALRVKVESRPYADLLSQYDGKVKQGKVKISPYKAPKMQSDLGVRIEGEINKAQKNVMIMIPIRDKTLIIWTESMQFIDDFDKIVMASLTFVP